MDCTNHQSVALRLEQLRQLFTLNQNPAKVTQFQAYLKTEQPMFGLTARPRKDALKTVLKQTPIIEQADYNQTILTFWQQPEREFQYCAIDTAVKYKKFHTAEAWPVFERLALTAKWWDLTDGIAVNLIGSLLKQDRQIQDILFIWAQDPDLWIRRTALLAHLKHKRDADFQAIEKTILTLCPDKQFFIQKAIGWTLREFSKNNPEWVVEFLDQHIEKLAPLAIREGTKYLRG